MSKINYPKFFIEMSATSIDFCSDHGVRVRVLDDCPERALIVRYLQHGNELLEAALPMVEFVEKTLLDKIPERTTPQGLALVKAFRKIVPERKPNNRPAR